MRLNHVAHHIKQGSASRAAAIGVLLAAVLVCAPCRHAHAGPWSELLDEDDSSAATTAVRAGEVLRDVAYGKDASQRFDVYLPSGPRNGKILLMVHGGAWAFGDKGASGVWSNKVAHWGAQGWVVVSTNYRMVPKANPLVQAQDVARALARVQQLAPSWGAKPHEVLLMGHSAGAHLVALITAQPQLTAEQGAQAWLGTVVLDSGAMDVEAIMTKRHFPLYDRAFGADRALWQQASPLQQLNSATVPTLLVCSLRRDVSCAQAKAYASRASQLGARAQVLPEDLSHMQINKELGLPGAYTGGVDAFIATLSESRTLTGSAR